MNFITVENYEILGKIAANMIASQLNRKPASVLGFATGSSPLTTYKNLIEMNKSGLVDFSQAVTFNLDEYIGLDHDNPQSYYRFMMENLFGHLNIRTENINIPNGKAADIAGECHDYEEKIKAAGGVDLQLLGVGHNGHIGFNEPDDVFGSYTRQVTLTESTINANKRFFARADDVPKTAISMGIKTIMAARQIVVVAGPDKAEIVGELMKEACTPKNPASILHFHPNCTFIWAKK